MLAIGSQQPNRPSYADPQTQFYKLSKKRNGFNASALFFIERQEFKAMAS